MGQLIRHRRVAPDTWQLLEDAASALPAAFFSAVITSGLGGAVTFSRKVRNSAARHGHRLLYTVLRAAGQQPQGQIVLVRDSVGRPRRISTNDVDFPCGNWAK